MQVSSEKYAPILEYLASKQVGAPLFGEQLESGEGDEILWSNDTNLLTREGFAVYQEGFNFTLDEKGNKRMSLQDEQKVLKGRGPYQFNYSTFFGVPFSNSHFTLNAHIYKISQATRHLPKQKLQIINEEQFEKAAEEVGRRREEAKKYV